VQKMSKSLGNYVGIADAPEDMFGKLMRVPDHLIGRYLRLTTNLDPAEIELLEADANAGGPGAGYAKRRLGREVVTLYHSSEAAEQAEELFDRLHKEHELPDEVVEATIPSDAVSDGRVQMPRLIHGVGLADSTSKARDLIKQGAVKLDQTPVKELEMPVEQVAGRVLQVGKRSFRRLLA
jgi:tyrosyl-tRNA synthetase